jgi:hypothetical protein
VRTIAVAGGLRQSETSVLGRSLTGQAPSAATRVVVTIHLIKEGSRTNFRRGVQQPVYDLVGARTLGLDDTLRQHRFASGGSAQVISEHFHDWTPGGFN